MDRRGLLLDDSLTFISLTSRSRFFKDWRPKATKLTVLIADAPPHGIGEVSANLLKRLASLRSMSIECHS